MTDEYQFMPEEARIQFAELTKQRVLQRIKEDGHGIEVGDIFSFHHNYKPFFLQVVRLRGKTQVVYRRIRCVSVTQESAVQGKVVPCPNRFLSPEMISKVHIPLISSYMLYRTIRVKFPDKITGKIVIKSAKLTQLKPQKWLACSADFKKRSAN